eukprot:337090-Rhodomonas_salina.1
MSAQEVVVYPRRKAGEPKRSRDAVCLTRQVLKSMFQQTVPRAAEMLGISPTALKKASRRLGIQSWPMTARMEVLMEGGSRTPTESPSSTSDACYIADSCAASESSSHETVPKLSSEDGACEEESARTKEQCDVSEGITEKDETTSVWAWSDGEVSWG